MVLSEDLTIFKVRERVLLPHSLGWSKLSSWLVLYSVQRPVD